jgi:hypothetical protein
VCKWSALLDRVRTRWEADGRPMKQPGASSAASQGGANTVILGKEYERVTARMNTLRQTYGDHQTWTQQDREELNKLRTRKAQLKQQLGIMV